MGGNTVSTEYLFGVAEDAVRNNQPDTLRDALTELLDAKHTSEFTSSDLRALVFIALDLPNVTDTVLATLISFSPKIWNFPFCRRIDLVKYLKVSHRIAPATLPTDKELVEMLERDKEALYEALDFLHNAEYVFDNSLRYLAYKCTSLNLLTYLVDRKELTEITPELFTIFCKWRTIGDFITITKRIGELPSFKNGLFTRHFIDQLDSEREPPMNDDAIDVTVQDRINYSLLANMDVGIIETNKDVDVDALTRDLVECGWTESHFAWNFNYKQFEFSTPYNIGDFIYLPSMKHYFVCCREHTASTWMNEHWIPVGNRVLSRALLWYVET